MIDPDYVQCMARYNRWQNDNLYAIADALSEAERRREREAFFGSIHGVPSPRGGIPESVSLYDDWGELKHERKAFDAVVIDWADRLDGASLAGELAYYSGAIKSHLRKPKWVLVTHMFNHQTHHRGQVHCMLTQAGGKPGDTDLPFMPT